jgi:hypothetical protein
MLYKKCPLSGRAYNDNEIKNGRGKKHENNCYKKEKQRVVTLV